MNVTTDELVRAFHRLDDRTKQAIQIAVLEQRNEELERQNSELSHQVEVLEEAVKMPEGYVRAPSYEVLQEIGNGVQVA